MQRVRSFCLLSLGMAVVAGLLVGVSPSAAFAGDTPVGFYYGTDTNGPAPTGTQSPYQNPPGCSGTYGFYAGRIDSVTDPFFNITAATDASIDPGVGDNTFYDLEGPLADPNYDPTASEAGKETEATTWGQEQGEMALANWTSIYKNGFESAGLIPSFYPIIFADVESGNSGYASPPGTVVDRDVFNGFHDTVKDVTIELGTKVTQVTVWAGIYSSPGDWTQLMSGNLTPSSGSYMWTFENANSSTSDGCPSGWSIPRGLSAAPFASYATGSNCFVAWQFVVSNAEDWDQVDASRIASDYGNSTCN
jgi:hypothetical protein